METGQNVRRQPEAQKSQARILRERQLHGLRLSEEAGAAGFDLHPGERLDDLQRDGARLIQNPSLFCFGMDAVLLAAFAEQTLRPGSRVLDLCSGNGIIPILMDARWQDRHREEQDAPDPVFSGIEINSICADMAARSAAGNEQTGRVHFIEGDLCRIRELVKPASFDLVTVNPPYMIGGHGLTGENEALTAARHEVLCSLEDVCAAAAYALRPQGRLGMVHRPFRLADIFRNLNAYGLEPKRMRLVHPMQGREPNMVLVEAVRGGRLGLTVETPLVIYARPGVYTAGVRAMCG